MDRYEQFDLYEWLLRPCLTLMAVKYAWNPLTVAHPVTPAESWISVYSLHGVALLANKNLTIISAEIVITH